MVTQRTESTTDRQERHSLHVIHYNISYVVQGAEHGADGAIVLLHDILGGAFAWDNVLTNLAGINRAVYAIDMLGYGQSEHPWPADTSIWGHADYMNFLLKQLNLTNVVLVGHGIGGGVAQILATRLCPQRVAALVLIDSICYEYTFAPDWPLPDMLKRQDQNAPMQTKLEDLMHDLRETVPNGAYHTDRLKDTLNTYLEPWDSELGKEVLFQHIRLLLPNYSNSVSSDLKTLGKPALIIWGEKDAQIPLKYAQRLHREMPGSRLVIVPEAGHMILFDAPAQVASALSDFIGRL
ncbi:MAG TPA: alpha/beta hydrolase [Ktedonobacteraceae bacterium]|nr:alpha/beta hydrolase [Ktedonobacteraceae bacterium]